MKSRNLLGMLAGLLISGGITQAVIAADLPESPDGLELVKRAGLDTLYVRKGVSLAKYRSVMLDPVEVAFDRNWNPKRGADPFDTADPQAIRKGLADLARQVFRRELEKKNGYPLVDREGADVLRVRAQIVNLYINAPESSNPAVRTYVVNAGEMTLMAELFDSETNALLARVADRKRGADYGPLDLQIANRMTNTAEADRILTGWALRLRKALDSARAN